MSRDCYPRPRNNICFSEMMSLWLLLSLRGENNLDDVTVMSSGLSQRNLYQKSCVANWRCDVWKGSREASEDKTIQWHYGKCWIQWFCSLTNYPGLKVRMSLPLLLLFSPPFVNLSLKYPEMFWEWNTKPLERFFKNKSDEFLSNNIIVRANLANVAGEAPDLSLAAFS